MTFSTAFYYLYPGAYCFVVYVLSSFNKSSAHCKIYKRKGAESPMGQAYFITGTGTDIGKTIVTSALYLSLQTMGKIVTIFKPFQTGMIEETNTYPGHFLVPSRNSV